MDNIPSQADAFYWKSPPKSSFIWRGSRRIDAGPISFRGALEFCTKNRIALIAHGYRWGPNGVEVTVRTR